LAALPLRDEALLEASLLKEEALGAFADAELIPEEPAELREEAEAEACDAKEEAEFGKSVPTTDPAEEA
jgi:hypothetical protein